jgi:hypothetical protein
MLAEMFYQNRFLTSGECDILIDYFKQNSDKANRGVFGYPPNAKVDFNRRICKTLLLDHEDSSLTPMINRVFDIVNQVNDDIFLFDVDWKYNRKPQSKSVWISEYLGEEKAHWANHQNVNWISNHMQKKLCASVVLSDTKDYEGGDILLNFGTTKDLPTPLELRGRGILYVYPAFRYTQINPVLTGSKYHLDFEFSGPYWR